MSLEIIRQLNVDFHDTKYISINAKQYDRFSRFILITCYDNGVIFPISSIDNYVFVRYRKSDDLGVFNSCEITEEGKILVELSEQMLATFGRCYADLVIVHNESTSGIDIDKNTGELIIGNNCSILSTMHFCINVIETSFNNVEIESSYEYDALNDLLIKATNDYTYVMNACKVSEEHAKASEINASTSESNAKTSENNAKKHENNAKTYASNAKTSETNASESAGRAKTSEDNAKTYSTNAKASELNAELSEDNAKTSEENAKVSETNAAASAASAEISEVNAKTSEVNAQKSADDASASKQAATEKATESSDYATLSQSYAVGGTNLRTDEDTDNAKYYYSQSKVINDNLQSSLETFLSDIDLIATDDNNGNVELIYFSSADTNKMNILENTIAELQNRVKLLEEQTVLGVTE